MKRTFSVTPPREAQIVSPSTTFVTTHVVAAEVDFVVLFGVAFDVVPVVAGTVAAAFAVGVVEVVAGAEGVVTGDAGGAGVWVTVTSGSAPEPASATSPDPRVALPPIAANATRAAIVTSPLVLRMVLPGPLVVGSR
ncbi:hypothetical protein [Terrabacter sp. C0L_2]|uniref:hypothetical protein n=1 Tax=Terrabacter sp. C0L_2 TaxID=3108389 RepID=UPI002ED38A2F|nr:hypothetical protein U5C87_03985 [Terrabacter sp. C0L_2]